MITNPDAGTRRLLAVVLIVTTLLAACRSERDTPEAQVRAFIHSAATAVEQKQLGTLRDMVSERYADEQGLDKRGVENLLRLQFLRNERLHLYTRIQSVTLPQPGRAHAVVLVAMAGVPITSEADLPALRADLHRFEIDFAREDKTWRAQRATWRRVEPGEFLSP
jgi:hypothetical protein